MPVAWREHQFRVISFYFLRGMPFYKPRQKEKEDPYFLAANIGAFYGHDNMAGTGKDTGTFRQAERGYNIALIGKKGLMASPALYMDGYAEGDQGFPPHRHRPGDIFGYFYAVSHFPGILGVPEIRSSGLPAPFLRAGSDRGGVSRAFSDMVFQAV